MQKWKIKNSKLEMVTCFRWFFRMVPSGSGSTGISSFDPVGGDSLFESKSTSQISSGNLKGINSN